ncbi:MAG: hypothetical protein GX781_01140 [Clostridiales bacterium]|nr:hypothetical protein [Clostridiales bacterium]
MLWDGDGALAYYEDDFLGNTWKEAEWEKGLSGYWGVVLFKRMFRIPVYRQMLIEKVEELHKIITPERITELIEEYRSISDPFLHRMPDNLHLSVTYEQLELIYQNLPNDTEEAYQNFLDSIEKPMPFYLNDVEDMGDSLLLSWGDAYDFKGELIYYNVEVATDWSFAPSQIVFFEYPRKLTLQTEIPLLPEGTYYWRVRVTNESGESQMAFDQVYSDTGIHTGMRRFVVNKDGEVINP